jgi:hypothetical protein
MANSFGYRWRPPTDRSVFGLEKPVQITAPIAHSEEVESIRLPTQRLKRSEAVERLERLELVPAWVSDVPNVAG